MVDTVKNQAKILGSLKEDLLNDTRTKGMVVRRMALVNTDPSLATNGWVGLYADSVLYEPRKVGAGSRHWEMTPVYRIIVQAVDRSSTEQAHDRLETYLKDVLDVVLSNTSLNDNVDALSSVQVDYAFDESERESLQFIGALVTLEFVGRTN